MNHRTRQDGLTILGFLFVAAVVVAIVMIGFRVTPAYIEYYSVEKALIQALADTKDYRSPVEVRKAFQARADAGYIESVRGTDVEVVKQGNEVIASAAWTRKLHLVGNMSLFLEFEASATR
jgi:Tfp pilus assembly major pilin PilA